MESLRNEPVNFSGGNAAGVPVMPTLGYTAYSGLGGGGGDLLGTIALLSLIGGRGLGIDKGCGFNFTGPALVEASALATAQGFSDTRSDVKDVASEVRESIHTQTLGLMGEFRGLDCKFNGIGRDALAAKYESAISNLQSMFAISNKIDNDTNRLSLENRGIQTSMDKQFCDLNNRLEHGFKDIEVGNLRTQLDELRRSEVNHRFRDLENMIGGLAANMRAAANVCNPATPPTIQLPVQVVPCVGEGTNLLKK